MAHFHAFHVAKTRMNAIRSRCFGSILAWILNTKPENFSSLLQINACQFDVTLALAPIQIKPSSIWLNTKVTQCRSEEDWNNSPFRNRSISNSCDALGPTQFTTELFHKSSPTALSSSGLFSPFNNTDFLNGVTFTD